MTDPLRIPAKAISITLRSAPWCIDSTRARTHFTRSALDAGILLAVIDRVVARHPHIKVLATTMRDHSTNRHTRSAVAWMNSQTCVAPTCELDVHDRVGGGFASGLFYGLLSGEHSEEALKLGWAQGALVTTFPGDTTMATVEQVRAFAKGGSARIQR